MACTLAMLFIIPPISWAQDSQPSTQKVSGMIAEWIRIQKEVKKARPTTQDHRTISRWYSLRRERVKAFALKYEGKARKPEEHLLLGQAQMFIPTKLDLATKNFQTALSQLPPPSKANEATQYSLVKCHYRLKQYEKASDLLLQFKNTYPTSRFLKSLDREKKISDLEQNRNRMIGQIAPPLLPMNHVGASPATTLKSMRNKVVLLEFWATWCSPCRKMLPYLKDLQTELGPEGLQVFSATRLYGYGFIDNQVKRDLSPDAELELISSYHKNNALNFPVVTVPKSTNTAYNIAGIPTAFVLDRQGKIVYTHMGTTKKELLKDAVLKALRTPESPENPK